MMMMLSLNIMMSLIFMTMSHPLSMGMILLIQTTLISLISGNLNFNFWYSYILFLVMIGGMLILFMYMTSIASNEKFKFNIKVLMIIPIIVIMIMITETFLMDLIMINKETTSMNLNMEIYNSMNKYTNNPMNIVLVFMMIYLLLTMIATVKISSLKSGPLRQMFN